MKAIAAVLVVAALALPLAGCGGDDEASPTTTTTTTETTDTATETTETTTETTTEPPAGPTTVRVVVEGGVPKGGIVRETVKKGDTVVLVVTSDVADEVHLHGYDLSRDVAAGGTARIRFKATIPGRFEVELEERRVPIAELTVNP
jgi:ABC-type glycerol-3-phosphate transport system substrate-binding protein